MVIVFEFYCEECEKWLESEDYGYGHDCQQPMVMAEKLERIW